MKKLLLLLLFAGSIAFAQDTVFFKIEPTKPHIVSKITFWSNDVYLLRDDKQNVSTVFKTDIFRIAYRDGYVYFGSDYMPPIVYMPPLVIDTLTNWDRINISKAGIHLKRATTFTFAAMFVGLGGAITAGVGFGTGNNSVGYVGLGVTGVGAILALIPPIQIGKAGNFLIKFGSQ